MRDDPPVLLLLYLSRSEAVADSNEEVAVAECVTAFHCILNLLATDITDTELSTHTYLEAVVLHTGTDLSTPVETIVDTILVKRLDV